MFEEAYATELTITCSPWELGCWVVFVFRWPEGCVSSSSCIVRRCVKHTLYAQIQGLSLVLDHAAMSRLRGEKKHSNEEAMLL
jgi:hypothetical protein